MKTADTSDLSAWRLPCEPPADQQQVLVTHAFDGERIVNEAVWDEHHEGFYDPSVYGLTSDPGEGPYGQFADVLAWMPMPEAYRG